MDRRASLIAIAFFVGTACVAAPDRAVAAPPADARIAFEWWSDTPDGGIDIESYAINDDGTGLVALGIGGSPAWSPGGTGIAFSGRDGIYIAAADGTNPTRVTADSGDDVPSWSPDGTAIVFAGNRPEDEDAYHIYIVNVDGSGVRRLTDPDPEAFNYYPSFAPDGTRISYSRGFDPAIYTRELATGSERRVSPDGTLAEYSAWSPDGTQIAFVAAAEDWLDDGDELYVVDDDGTNPRRVLAGAAGDIYDRPTWSPDGTRLAFVTLHKAPPQSYGLYIVNVDGSGLTRLTDSTAIQANAAWQPVPARRRMRPRRR